VAVSGARAADAVIIPEPEVVEYVRVCDAAGTGFFYIPGSETCLKIGGYARFEIKSDWYDDGDDAATFFSRGALQVSSWTDSEYGPVKTFFEYHMDSDRTEDNDVADAYVNQVYFTIAGLKMGYFEGFLDNGINGESDSSGLNSKFDSIQYTGTAGAVSFGVAIDELYNDEGVWTDWYGAEFGIEAMLGFSAGAIDAQIIGFYDVYYESFGVNARVSADVGAGTLQARGIWVEDKYSGYVSDYGNNGWSGPAKWVAEVSYAMPVGDKLTLTPGFSYREYYGDDTKWKAGLTADYDITETLALKTSLQYTDFNDDWNSNLDYNGWDFLARFTASF
ncbi:porin, partial [Oricola sp.]|uniref:porin n=1 Tax=Oricola sp. TaxID=1979950 RepID=UPI0025CBAD2B